MSLATLPRPARLPSAKALPRSPKERMWLLGGGTAAVLMTVVAYFFFISPQQSQTDDVDGRISAARSQNAVLQTRLEQLSEQNKSYARFHAELVAAQQALPSTSGVSDFLRSLQSLGSQTQTSVISLGVGQPADATALANGQAVGTGSAASAPAAGSAAGSAAGPAAGPARPAAPAVYSLPIQAQVTGSAAALNRFLDQLQNVQPRAVLITSLVESAAAGGSSGTTTLNLGLEAFVAPPAASAASPITGPHR